MGWKRFLQSQNLKMGTLFFLRYGYGVMVCEKEGTECRLLAVERACFAKTNIFLTKSIWCPISSSIDLSFSHPHKLHFTFLFFFKIFFGNCYSNFQNSIKPPSHFPSLFLYYLKFLHAWFKHIHNPKLFCFILFDAFFLLCNCHFSLSNEHHYRPL